MPLGGPFPCHPEPQEWSQGRGAWRRRTWGMGGTRHPPRPGPSPPWLAFLRPFLRLRLTELWTLTSGELYLAAAAKKSRVAGIASGRRRAAVSRSAVARGQGRREATALVGRVGG